MSFYIFSLTTFSVFFSCSSEVAEGRKRAICACMLTHLFRTWHHRYIATHERRRTVKRKSCATIGVKNTNLHRVRCHLSLPVRDQSNHWGQTHNFTSGSMLLVSLPVHAPWWEESAPDLTWTHANAAVQDTETLPVILKLQFTSGVAFPSPSQLPPSGWAVLILEYKQHSE